MGKTVYSYIIALVDYAEEKGLADKADRMYYINRLLELLQLDSFEETAPAEGLSLQTLATYSSTNARGMVGRI